MPTKLNFYDFMNNEVNMIYFYDIKSNHRINHLQRRQHSFWPLRGFEAFRAKTQSNRLYYCVIKRIRKSKHMHTHTHAPTHLHCSHKPNVYKCGIVAHNKMVFLLSWNTTLMPFGKRIMVELNAFCKHIKQYIKIMECKTIYYWLWSAKSLR